MRYAGSPIPMSFAEKHYHHGVVEVTFDGGCAVDIMRVECPRLIPLMSVPNGEPASPEIVLEILKELPVTEGAEPYLEDKNYRLARIVSTYRNETGNAEKENENWKRGLQEMSPLQIAQSAFEKIYQVEMPEELTDLFQEAYLAATRKEEEEE